METVEKQELRVGGSKISTIEDTLFEPQAHTGPDQHPVFLQVVSTENLQSTVLQNAE